MDKEDVVHIYNGILLSHEREWNSTIHRDAGNLSPVQFSYSPVQLFATPWIAARQASLSITNSWSSPKPMSIKSVMPSNHLVLCRPLLLLPPIFPSIRVFSIESALRIRWPKYWNFSFNISPSSEHPELISFRMDWLATKLYTLKLLILHYMNFALKKTLFPDFFSSCCNYYL